MSTKFLGSIVVAALVCGIHTADAEAEVTMWGNPFVYGTGSTFGYTIDSTAKLADTRFTAVEDLVVDQFAVSVGTVTGSPDVIVSLYADDGAGNPGTLLATSLSGGTLTPGASYTGTLSSSVSLSTGSVYHIVTGVANADASNKIGVNFGTGSDIRYSPESGALDPNLNRLTSSNGGGSWLVANANQANAGISQAVVKNSVSGNSAGQSVGTLLLGANSGVGATISKGQQFTYTGPSGQGIESITLRLKKGAGTAAGDLRVVLLDSTNAVLSDTVLFQGGTFTNTAFDLYTLTLPEVLSLTPESAYKLVLYSPDSATDSYEAYFPGTLLAAGATFQGTGGYAITGTNLGNFNTISGSTFDMYFAFGMAPVPEPSSLALTALSLIGWLIVTRSKKLLI